MPKWRDVNDVLEEDSRRQTDKAAGDELSRLDRLMRGAPGATSDEHDDDGPPRRTRLKLKR